MTFFGNQLYESKVQLTTLSSAVFQSNEFVASAIVSIQSAHLTVRENQFLGFHSQADVLIAISGASGDVIITENTFDSVFAIGQAISLSNMTSVIVKLNHFSEMQSAISHQAASLGVCQFVVHDNTFANVVSMLNLSGCRITVSENDFTLTKGPSHPSTRKLGPSCFVV